jgi:hypothetical protein
VYCALCIRLLLHCPVLFCVLLHTTTHHSAFTGGLSRGLAQLTLDDEYIREHHNDSDKRRGVLRGVRALGMGLVHGLSGIFVDPYKGAKKEGVKGFLKGVGKGLIGVVAKPAAGALDFGTKTIQGMACCALCSAVRCVRSKSA